MFSFLSFFLQKLRSLGKTTLIALFFSFLGSFFAFLVYAAGTGNFWALYFDQTNNRVGINESTPGYALDIRGQTRVQENLILRNVSPTLYLQDTDQRSAMIHANSNYFYVLRGSGNDSLGWYATGWWWPLQINLDDNHAYLGGDVDIAKNVLSYGTITAPRIKLTENAGDGKVLTSDASGNARWQSPTVNLVWDKGCYTSSIYSSRLTSVSCNDWEYVKGWADRGSSKWSTLLSPICCKF